MADARPPAGARAGRAVALAILFAAIGQGSASAPADTPVAPPVVGPASPCPDQPSESAQACSDRPLDAKTYVPLQVFHGLTWNADAYVLKSAVYGQPYDAQLVQGGGGGYTGHTVGHLPDGLHIDAAGHLFGTPTPKQPGPYNFLLVIRDNSREARELVLTFQISVTQTPGNGKPVGGGGRPPPHRGPDRGVWPPPPPSPGPIGPPPTPTPPPATPSEAPAILAYMLSAKQFALLDAARPPPPPAPSKSPPTVGGRMVGRSVPPPAPVPPPAAPDDSTCYQAPQPDPMRMVSIEYPYASLFKTALRCRYGKDWSASIEQTALEVSAANWYETSHKGLAWYAPWKLTWNATPGCNCTPPGDGSMVYGFYPFWRAPLAAGVDFSRFNRISLLGVQMNASGGWLQPNLAGDEVWGGVTSRLADQAVEHGAEVDLVLRIADVATLRRLSGARLMDFSARGAVAIADTPLAGGRLWLLPLPRPQTFLAWFWHSPRYAFGGVTVMLPAGMFTDPAADGNALADEFITALIRAMQKSGRAYVLNIVAPDSLSVPGPGVTLPDDQERFWTNYLKDMKIAEPASGRSAIRPEPDPSRQPYLGSTNITVRMILPMRESTKITQKTLRSNVEKPPQITGADRASVLNSIIPVLFTPSGDASALSPTASRQLDDDMIYFKQNFGGVALWPLPLKGVGAGDEIYTRVQENFFSTGNAICSTPVRLFWQFVALSWIISTVLLLTIRPLNPVYRYVWWAWTGLAVVLGLVLLECDPGLAEVKKGNSILIASFVVAVVGGFVGFMRPKITPP